ncbi:hypothetical protein NHX12_023257 [Muraenolepis orangiensis]|uniref:Uncharacterized protein n=1 Tax=Muraenolepis orangiensis TaxID=630683 RepID=A0A9Q0IPW8_9TELE|nr:hypothetical protein NHX12_023257 [Muraenolepis orangiensis]
MTAESGELNNTMTAESGELNNTMTAESGEFNNIMTAESGELNNTMTAESGEFNNTMTAESGELNNTMTAESGEFNNASLVLRSNLPDERWSPPSAEERREASGGVSSKLKTAIIGSGQPSPQPPGTEVRRAGRRRRLNCWLWRTSAPVRPLVVTRRTCAGSGHSVPGGPAGLTDLPRLPPGSRGRERAPRSPPTNHTERPSHSLLKVSTNQPHRASFTQPPEGLHQPTTPSVLHTASSSSSSNTACWRAIRGRAVHTRGETRKRGLENPTSSRPPDGVPLDVPRGLTTMCSGPSEISSERKKASGLYISRLGERRGWGGGRSTTAQQVNSTVLSFSSGELYEDSKKRFLDHLRQVGIVNSSWISHSEGK